MPPTPVPTQTPNKVELICGFSADIAQQCNTKTHLQYNEIQNIFAWKMLRKVMFYGQWIVSKCQNNTHDMTHISHIKSFFSHGECFTVTSYTPHVLLCRPVSQTGCLNYSHPLYCGYFWMTLCMHGHAWLGVYTDCAGRLCVCRCEVSV